MIVFNSIQIVTLLAAGPFILQWLLQQKQWQYLGYVGCLGYLLLFVWMVEVVYRSIEQEYRR